MAGLPVGACRGALHPGPGLPAARAGLAAPFRRPVRPGRPEPGPWLLPGGDGPAQPSRCRVRVREDPDRLRLPVGAGPGTHGRGTRRGRAAAAAPAAPPGLRQLPGRGRQHHRRGQDPGQRHQAGRPDAAVLRGQGPVPLGPGRQWRAAAGHPDRRRGKRRGDDERIPAQVLRGDPGVLGHPDPGHERHRVPRTAPLGRHRPRRSARDPASVPVQDLGPDGPRRRAGPAGRGDRAAARRGRALPHGRRQLDQQHLLGPRLRAGARPDGRGQLAVPRAGPGQSRPHRRPPLPQRPVPPARRRGKRLPLLGAEGIWADYGAELARRAIDIVTHDL